MSMKPHFLAVALFPILFSSEARARNLGVECLLRGSCIQGQEIMEHLKTLQTIADQNLGNRSAGSRGHELSGNFIAQKLLAVGYKVQLEPFSFSKFSKISGALETTFPVQTSYVDETDFNVMTYSGSGSAKGALVPVNLQLGSGNASTSGCEAKDFTNFPAGSIALIQRGTCAFVDKVVNAQNAGATAVIIFNQGNTPDREELFLGTISESAPIRIPVLATSYKLGTELLKDATTEVSLEALTKVESKTSFNVIAESIEGNPDNVVMIGAHLDSVAEGPGINDNGSGSAAILEVALKMRNTKTANKLRFAWFSAEELGLIGSTKYVEGLTESERQKISLYINVDMVGSPNYKLAVYDGDGSKFGQKGPEGSEAIEELFHKFYATQGSGSVETELNGRSDYAAFSAAGIAVGGIFTGAEGKKSEEEAILFGGTAGEDYDACYHKACDDISNIHVGALELNTNAIAYSAVTFGNSIKFRNILKHASPLARRTKVVFPKHHSCQGDVHGE